ncbi:CDC27 family protein [Campylobacter majalis]|uniref:CDC27 family protein n=1 Tax=Campylobacter majalis TaxID=2790656 RepID=UPI003D68833A
MLSLSELNELEARYERLINRPNKVKKSLIIALIILILVLTCFIYHNTKQTPAAKSYAKEIQEKTQIAINKLQQEQPLSDDASEQSQQPSIKTHQEQGWLKLNKIQISHTDSTISDISQTTKPNEKQIKKIDIQVTQTNLNEIDALKENFNKTHNINYALALAEKFLNQKDYNQAIEWALNANELDNDNEQSWIIFATAKYKQGNKDDALKALNSHNRGKNSPKITNLINQIKSNSL